MHGAGEQIVLPNARTTSGCETAKEQLTTTQPKTTPTSEGQHSSLLLIAAKRKVDFIARSLLKTTQLESIKMFQDSSKTSRKSRRRLSRAYHRQSSLESIPEDVSKEFKTGSSSSSSLALLPNRSASLAFVNRERARRNLPPFTGSAELFRLAENHCQNMASKETVYHSVDTIEELVAQLQAPHAAENVQRGVTVADIDHETLSQKRSINYNNLFSTVFEEFGAAYCVGMDGKVYLCQLFRN